MRFGRFTFGGRIVSCTLENNRLIGPQGEEYSKDLVAWLPPVSPSKILGLALNYADHADELGLQAQNEPILMFKPPSSLVGHLGAIIYPRGARFMHYEAELAIVMGRAGRRVPKERASEFIKGYTIANDVTVRDFITNTFRPPVKAKGFDTFCPLGPLVVTQDELQDVSNLELKTVVNGNIVQRGSTKNMIHSVEKLVEFISEFMTLEEGDLILTGTPKGISPVSPGDRIDISIDKIGTLSNIVVSETA